MLTNLSANLALDNNNSTCTRLSYPKQQLLFFVVQDTDEHVRAIVRELVVQIVASGSWVISPPIFFDSIEDLGAIRRVLPDATVGGIHEIYAATLHDLPKPVDAQHLAEVERIAEFVRRFSAEHSMEFEFELDGTYVGTISDGNIDDTFSKGLIDEWRRKILAMPD